MNFLERLIAAPLIVYIADILSPQINFSFIWQIIITGWVLAVIGFIADNLLLHRTSIITMTWIDLALSTLIIWMSSLFLVNSHITFSGSLFTGILLGFTEYLDHRHIMLGKLQAKRNA